MTGFDVRLWMTALGVCLVGVSAAQAGQTTTQPRPIGVEAVGDAIVSTPIAEVRAGQRVVLEGRVTRVLDRDEFRLADETGSIRVYVGWRNEAPVETGDRVVVEGVVDDDLFFGLRRPEVYATAMTTRGGERIVFRDAPSPADLGDAPAERGRERAVRAATPRVDIRTASITPVAEARPEEVVALRGVVDRITDEDEFRLRDETGSIEVYVGWRNRVPAAEGERVTVLGIVDADGPGGVRREVYAYDLMRADGTVMTLQRPAAPASGRADDPDADSGGPAPGGETFGPITRIADVRRGQSVTLAGTVTRIRDTDEFMLEDESGRIEVYIGWRNAMPVRVGERVTVIGVADDDVFPGRRPDIYARRIALADGRVVRLLADE